MIPHHSFNNLAHRAVPRLVPLERSNVDVLPQVIPSIFVIVLRAGLPDVQYLRWTHLVLFKVNPRLYAFEKFLNCWYRYGKRVLLFVPGGYE